MDIAIPIFDRFTALDAVGPYEILSRIPGAAVHFVAEQPGPKRTDNGMLAMVADRALDDVPEPEVIVVPGGPGTRPLLDDEALLRWIRRAHETSMWTTSVCTGALLLGAAGVLNGIEATTHWAELETLRRFGATPVQRRVVEQGKVITAAGVSAGIDMALTLTERLASREVAMAIQLVAEYDPQPPFDAGSLANAPQEVVELLRTGLGSPQPGSARP
ncbi:MAG: DJ-1/PfpI family protein [Solirubrobacteraceae bacterium]